ncbi:hypothetical protein DLD77_04890 [Chitinophaga alhagiae]|uniref:Putative auto-transporter adhesin head GIN domain-containing protein n=1 Tax=Chitinophaga alhagiae TaxID=2203219 RepID=A0ABN5LP96_9BACT|nr:head GIN domain-containing protein [Chitinophaga alhagiae]AWO01082.1 hypothetical protein DLD77_04890 [Chitinophaga alhagiae]
MKMTAKKETIVTYSGLCTGLLLCLLAIFGLILTGCARENLYGSGKVVTEERTVARFEDLVLEGPLEVHLQQGLNAPLRLEAEDNVMRFIETSVNGATLRVKIRDHVNLKRIKPIHVYVESEKYRKIVFSGSGSLNSNGADTIKTTLFSYEINGSANADLKVAANEVNIWVNGSGNLELEGTAGDYVSEINGSGNIGAAGLQSVNASIRINGSGEQQIWVTGKLDARIQGSGNIRYKGTPSTVNTSVSGSGKVSKL